jgi:hypothetical protein
VLLRDLTRDAMSLLLQLTLRPGEVPRFALPSGAVAALPLSSSAATAGANKSRKPSHASSLAREDRQNSLESDGENSPHERGMAGGAACGETMFDVLATQQPPMAMVRGQALCVTLSGGDCLEAVVCVALRLCLV